MASMKKSLLLIFVFVFSSLFLGFSVPSASSDQVDDLAKQINDLTSALNMSVAATKPLESELNKMKTQITGIKARVTSIENDVIAKKKVIDDGYKNLEKQQGILNHTIRDFYIRSYNSTPLLILLSAPSASELTQILAYQKAAADQDKAVILNIALSISDLEEKKKILENEQERLLVAKKSLDEQSAKLDKVVGGAKAYQSTLSGKIADLSAKQQSIINARSGNFTASIGDSELADDYNASIKGFREAAPSGSFAVFSFGAYTHRNGMSQYGALGRYTSGKNTDAESILKFYYPNATLKRDYGVPGTISISGFGTRAFEDEYMKRIYEVPGSWPKEVLKAQAVAARTYALRYTNNGSPDKPICANEGCQVYKDSNKGGAWDEAANDTRGWVLVDGGGGLVSTQFSSTAGGWSNTSGWDTTDGGGGGSFIDKSYEKIGGSPWLYKAWYRKGYSNQGDTCGKSNPWLSSEEMADIVNAAVVSVDDRITPITTSCWGGNPYSMQELRDKGGVSSVSSVNVLQGNGSTNEVVFQTNKGEVRISGKQFRNAVALRAPGYIRIPQGEYPNGWTFFNIEKK